jgi:hypothetical protein
MELISKEKQMKKKISSVKLFVEMYWEKPIIKKYGFRFTDISLHKIKNGWYAAEVNWAANKDEYLFKNCYSVGKMHSFNNVCQHLRFSNLSKKHKFEIDIGIQNKNLKIPINFTPEYFVNLKYGVWVCFAPIGWEFERSTIQEYKFDEKGELITNSKKSNFRKAK